MLDNLEKKALPLLDNLLASISEDTIVAITNKEKFKKFIEEKKELLSLSSSNTTLETIQPAKQLGQQVVGTFV